MMKTILTSLSISLISFVSCGQASQRSETVSLSTKASSYTEQHIPDFFKRLLLNHKNDFHRQDSLGYQELCEQHGLLKTDSSNFDQYYTLYILHQLFTSKTASNGSKGDILNIPYFWHWVSPNPRYRIYATENNKLLKDLKPAKDFARYKSRADIDRTPFLYWSDLFTAKPQYYAAGCDTFSTFGWCSEREMACVNLLEVLKFEGKVVAEGNHCWSEFWVGMKTSQSTLKYFEVRLDNTFDGFVWELSSLNHKSKWKAYLGNLGDSKWYNSMAHSASEKAKLKDAKASVQAMQSIENAVVHHLNP